MEEGTDAALLLCKRYDYETGPLADTNLLGTMQTYLVTQAGYLIHHILLIRQASFLGLRARHRLPIVFAVDL